MSPVRLLGVLVAACLLVVGMRPADACGVWKLVDKEKGRQVSWLINAGEIYRGKTRLAALYLDSEHRPDFRVVKQRKVIFDVKDGVLRRHGKPIGKVLDTGEIVVGAQTFAVTFSEPHDFHGMTAWNLTVTRGDVVVLESTEATSLCAPMHRDPPMTEAEQQDDVRRRVAYYLAWRARGM